MVLKGVVGVRQLQTTSVVFSKGEQVVTFLLRFDLTLVIAY